MLSGFLFTLLTYIIHMTINSSQTFSFVTTIPITFHTLVINKYDILVPTLFFIILIKFYVFHLVTIKTIL